MRSRPISPNIRRKDNKVIDDDHLKKRRKKLNLLKNKWNQSQYPILEARKRKFECNKPIEQIRKKIILKKSNSVQVAIQTENKELQNEMVEPEIKTKTMHLTNKIKKKPSQAFQAPKNISIKMNNDFESTNIRRVVKVNTAPVKISNKKRPRIVFAHDEVNELLTDEDDKFDQHNEKKKEKNC